MDSFDAVIYIGLVLAVVTGFNAGLLRSAVTILAYLIAMPIAVWAMSLVSPAIDGNLGSLLTQNSLLFFGIFLVIGMVLGKLMRMALDETIGSEAGIGDRLAGAAQKEAACFSGNDSVGYEYTVISNIYSGGLPPAEAGGVIVDKVGEILRHQAAGNRLESLLKKRVF